MFQAQVNFKRYEKKYLITPEQYGLFKEKTLLYIKPDEHSKYTLCNLYYDTDSYSLIRASLEKPVYKEKLRIRSYGVPGPEDRVFVELKKKYNGVVYKRRAVLPESSAYEFLSLHSSTHSQIEKEIAYFQSFHYSFPKVFIAYDREAYQGINNSELRITFDTNIRWRTDRLKLSDGDDGYPLLNNNLILLEIKAPGNYPLWLSKILSELKIFPVSFSKYGTCYKKNLMADMWGKKIDMNN